MGRRGVRIRSIFIDFNITNSQNDFTLARLNAQHQLPLPLPLGRGNETDGLETPLLSSGYGNIAFSVDMGCRFEKPDSFPFDRHTRVGRPESFYADSGKVSVGH